MVAAKRRADQLLVERGLAESRQRAQALILAGLVYAGERRIDKAGQTVPEETLIVVRGRDHPWVSRGGVKLAHALDCFAIKVADLVALDIGASTGGFTDVLLARGARRVYAVDVGTGQLHPSLRADARIVSIEETDIRRLDPSRLAERPDVIAVDVSFISLRLVLPSALALAARPAHLVALVKPQFEAPRASIKKGIVRDPAVHEAVCAGIADFAASLGCTNIVSFPSPIAGADGNREFFIGAELG
jgi:23S rRNA (cytidine1920-2'-O)/16S rRNA (cytidine1409-2'-O)-methyltransferase